jgi:hypothetical protein
MRALIAVVAAASVVALGGAGVASATTATVHTASSKAAACQPGTLKAVVTGTQAEMSSFGTVLKVTNTGKAICTISGYAGLALEGSGHKAIKTTVKHGSTYFTKNPGAHTVTLKHGQSAYADLAWTRTGTHTANAKYLQIAPTGSNSHSTVGFSHPLDNGVLTETAWSTSRPKTN